MLSVHTLERVVEERDHERLVRGLSENGLDLPLGLQIRLAGDEVAPLALALRRLSELTWGPSRLSRDWTHRLIQHQAEGGAFCGDPLTTAAALAALLRVLDNGLCPDHAGEVRASVDRGTAALAAMQDADGLFTADADRSISDRALSSAFLVCLLGPEPSFRSAVRLYDLYGWFEAQEHRLDRGTRRLWDLASIHLADPVSSADAAVLAA